MGTLAYAAENGPGPRKPKAKPAVEKPSADQLFERFDANKDGKLTPEEAPDPMKANFAKIDTDNDGLITKDELTAHFKSADGKKRPGVRGGPRSR